jgi:hypothetical protein
MSPRGMESRGNAAETTGAQAITRLGLRMRGTAELMTRLS